MPPLTFANVEAHLLKTKQRTIVPLFLFRTPGARYTLIFSHGNAADIGLMSNTFEFLAKTLKVNVVGYDYTGYGASQEYGVAPTEKQTFQDIECVYQWCIDKKLVTNPGEEVILYGQSVGSGPSCYLARRKPVAGLILHSPFLSGLRVITPSRLLACFDIFPNLKHIRGVKNPVFIIHGRDDVEVGFFHGQQLYDLVGPTYRFEPWWVPNRGHNDVLQGNEREFVRLAKVLFNILSRSADLMIQFYIYYRRLREFLEHVRLHHSAQRQLMLETAVSNAVTEKKRTKADGKADRLSTAESEQLVSVVA